MLLEELSNAPGVSGDENRVRELVIQAMKGYVDQYRVDSIGNLLTRKAAARGRGRKNSPKVMLAAHMDEVGLLIEHADNDGRLLFQKVGGIDNRVLPSKVVLVGKDRVPGVIGFPPPHVTTANEREKVIQAKDLRIDIGAKTKGEALGAVNIGDYASFATEFTPIGDGLVRGKAFDDRAGCAALVELLNEDYPFELYAIFTVQEEVGLRGARVAAYSLDPDIAIVLEATVCDDSPKETDVSPTTRLGCGPAMTIADRSFIADKRLAKLFLQTAQENQIPIQVKQPLIGGTDAGRLHLTRKGIPSIALAVPTRYIHSPASVMAVPDFGHLQALLQAGLPKFGNGLKD